jgi:hypothetical protein
MNSPTNTALAESSKVVGTEKTIYASKCVMQWTHLRVIPRLGRYSGVLSGYAIGHCFYKGKKVIITALIRDYAQLMGADGETASETRLLLQSMAPLQRVNRNDSRM